MQPSARIAAVIDLAAAIEAQNHPADLIASGFFHARRYIGSGDRRDISLRLWGMLRRRAKLDWWLRARGRPRDARNRILADLVFDARLTLAEITALFTGKGHGPEPLDKGESDLVQALQGLPLVNRHMTAWVVGEYPEWLEPRLRAVFGPRLALEMAAMNQPAPVDLRVNLLKGDRETALRRLAADGLSAEPTHYSPVGLRLPARVALTAQGAFRDGLVEVQDEGSQLVALLVGARPGEAVCDYCAGAGGKTLALAAAMMNRGRLVALDTDERRSDRAAERLKRAGVDNVQRRVIAGPSDKWLKRQEGLFDRVLVDAPCSGAGTWRRNPDAKWRLTQKDLDELAPLQASILASAARLVKPGGRLVYATCSLFAEENEAQAEGFLATARDFEPVPSPPLWKDVTGSDWVGDGPWLRLTPARHETDGFFVAAMRRRA